MLISLVNLEYIAFYVKIIWEKMGIHE